MTAIAQLTVSDLRGRYPSPTRVIEAVRGVALALRRNARLARAAARPRFAPTNLPR
jgi:hypothetical protein